MLFRTTYATLGRFVLNLENWLVRGQAADGRARIALNLHVMSYRPCDA